MFEEFKKIEDIDWSKVTCPEPSLEQDGNESEDSNDSWTDDEDETYLMYEGEDLLFVIESRGLDIRKQNVCVPKDVMEQVQKSLKDERLCDTFLFEEQTMVFDKSGFQITSPSDIFLKHMCKTNRFKAVVSIFKEKYSLHSSYRMCITMIHFMDHVSSMSKLYEKVGEIQKTLDIPNNVGSIEGWLEIFRTHMENSNAEKK